MNGLRNEGRLYFQHALLLLTGCLLGIVSAYAFNLITFDLSGEIQKARDLGIVSRTVLDGYPKSRDLITYVTVLFFPVIFSLSFWFLWARNRKKQLGFFLSDGDEVPAPRGAAWTTSLSAVIVFYLIISFNINSFYYQAWNPRVGPWILLGEEGVNLAWIQSIFPGGVYAKDFYCLYGPMMIYPLAWFMKLFGATVVAERIWKYTLDIMAYSIIIFFLYKTLKWKYTFIVSSVIYFFFFPPFFRFSLNTTYLRVSLGILPLLLTYIYFGNGKKYLLVVTGLVIGQSLLFSQEVGICSLISSMAVLLLHFYFNRDGRSFVKAGLYVAAGCIISIAPMMIYLSLKGALVPFIDDFLGYPRLIMLGYACLPFPALNDFFADPLGQPLFFYWPIFIYIMGVMYLAPSILIGKVNKDHLLGVSLLIFGVLLFRVALSRTSTENIQRVLPPAVLLLILVFDRSITILSTGKWRFLKIAHAVLLGVVAVSTIVVVSHTDYLKDRFAVTLGEITSISDKWSVTNKYRGSQVPSLERGGIFYDPATARALINIHDFLEVNTKPGDYVYFFPNEAAYYFLFNRNNPTRYSFSYTAVTAAQRKELVDSLEKNKPQYVVYSRKTWRVDGIPESIQVPEVVRYLQDNYRMYQDMGAVVIEKRIGT